MTPRVIALLKAEQRCLEKIAKLEPHLDEPDAWRDYLATVTALAAIAPQLHPDHLAAVLTQAELAERLGVSTRTLRRRNQRAAK